MSGQTIGTETEGLIRRYLDGAGKIRTLPQKILRKRAVLQYLASKFDEREAYAEREINEILVRWHTFDDYFLLRRELVDAGFLCRTTDGSRYWKPREETAASCDKEKTDK